MNTSSTNKIPVTVYAESTPNPAAMKFVSSRLLLPEGAVEYGSAEAAASCPLAQSLFAFSGIRNVFITSNFITLTKAGETDWYEIMPILREFIRESLMQGEPLFIGPATGQPAEPEKQVPAAAGTETEAQVIALLEEFVKPAVEQDGGAIHFRSLDNGVVTVALKGSCSGCPSSTLTLKSGIENLLKQMIPGITSVVAEAE